jgi:hypothetical protein
MEYGDSSKTLKIDLPCDLAIPPLGICLKECKSTHKRDTCIPVFVAVLFIMVKP